MRTTRLMPALILLSALAILLTGCASTAGSAKPLTAVAAPGQLARYTKVALTTSAGGDASRMTAADRERIAGRVVRKVMDQAPGRFADTTTTTTDAGTLHVSIAFTRYDEGNAFARFMLAGLGQIHIDAAVTLEDGALPAVLGTYDVTKTFAWGGLYGVATGIKDVEDGFAEAVAKVILGQPTQ